MPNDFNVSITPPAATEGAKPSTNGQVQQAPIARKADAPLVRNIGPLTDYNTETGMRENRSDKPVEEPKKETPSKSSSEERQAKWKAEQADKKLARQDQQTKLAADKQALAKDMLFRGDLAGAAKALGMTPTDLATYVDNARLQIVNKETKEILSPEQMRAKEDADYRQERKNFEQDQANFKYHVIKTGYIKDNIAPAIADKDKYEFIHKQGADKIQDYMYEYMNKHFQETGEALNAADIADAIEEQMVQSYTSSLEQLRGMKKVSSFFAKQKAEEEQIAGEEDEEAETPNNRIIEPVLKNLKGVALSSRFGLKADDDQAEADRLIAEAEEDEQKLLSNTPVRKTSTSNSKTPFAFLSKEERMAQIKANRQ